ncbi:MAG: MiaB/RimO family radical SAM methylthiotransferase [Candidatus Omnitrophica bacterium]|nr:MiaB/RimO family radical SAM methylthiotransferase [Candidatus Omnitrophota bacterium]
MNNRDSEVIAGLLRNRGFGRAGTPEEADVVILNTCSVRQKAEEKVWSEIGRLAKMSSPPVLRSQNKTGGTPNPLRFADANLNKGATNPKTKKIIGLVGCMAQNYKEQVFERAPAVDFVVGPGDIDKIPGIVERLVEERGGNSSLFERKLWETDGRLRPGDIYHTGFREDKEHAFVVISEGCSNYCSYCVVPYTRGKLRHRPHGDILREVEEAVAQGIARVTLLGQNVNSYSSGGVNFIDLLKTVNQVPRLAEFSFITSHPRDTGVGLFEAMSSLDKLKKYLHLPVQSGSDRILALMKRGYTRKFYFELVEKYRKIVKDGVLTTDIILGFPGEREEDFQDTYDLVKRVAFDAAFIFKYSPRPHAAASQLVDDVPKKEKERRHGIILELQKSISRGRKQCP